MTTATLTEFDAFYFIHAVTKYPAVFSFIQSVCCLIHGQSSVERGFSLNRDTAKQNMHEDSCIARRFVKDRFLANNYSGYIPYHQRFDFILHWCKKKVWSIKEKESDWSVASGMASSIAVKIAELKAEQKLLLQCNIDLDERFGKLLSKGCTRNDMNLIHQANGLKWKLEENKETSEKIGKRIAELKKQRTDTV